MITWIWLISNDLDKKLNSEKLMWSNFIQFHKEEAFRFASYLGHMGD